MTSQMFRWFTCNFLFITILAIPFSAQIDANTRDKTFQFNISPNGYPPYLIVDGPEPSGIVWDVVELITERIGYTLKAEKIPRMRIDQMLLDGYVDGSASAKEWTDHPENYLFTDPIVHIEEVFFIPGEANVSYESPGDLISKTLVTRLGFHYPALDSYFEQGLITRFDTSRDREMFIFTLHGSRFDAAVADRLVGQWFIKNEGFEDKFRISHNNIGQYGLRIILNKKLAEFAEAFNEELAHIRRSGELDAILANYQ